jgi:thioredoxin reductase (NADPH)
MVALRATGLSRADGHYVVQLDNGSDITCRTVVIATGAWYRKLEVARLDEFEGSSVYYAATEIEAQLCRLDPVAIVGGGNSAGQAAVFLSEHAPTVYLLIRGSDLGQDMSRYLVDRIERLENVHVMTHTEVTGLIGDDTLTGIDTTNNRTGERQELDARALFIFIGARPRTSWLGDILALDDSGFILTGREVAPDMPALAPTQPVREPLLLETSQSGIFAVGDVRSGSIKRVASAVGEGSMAIRFVWEHLSGMHELDGSAQRQRSPRCEV